MFSEQTSFLFERLRAPSETPDGRRVVVGIGSSMASGRLRDSCLNRMSFQALETCRCRGRGVHGRFVEALGGKRWVEQ